MRRLSKQSRILMSTVAVLMIMVILGITYAAFSQNLNINGSGVVRNSSWNIHFVTSGSHIEGDKLKPANTLSSSVKILSDPTISDTTIGDYEVSLTTPGDTVEYRFDVINEGDYNAKISGFTLPSPVCKVNGIESDPSAQKVCSQLTYSLKYVSGSDVSSNDVLLSKETKTLVLTLKYNDFQDATLLPSSDVEISHLGFTINYVQDETAVVNNDDGTTPKVYETYSVGTVKQINGEDYYVIDDRGTNSSYVTLLKANPLSVEEINLYGGVGTDHNHVNEYFRAYSTENGYKTATTSAEGYGGMAYYTSETCGIPEGADEVWEVTDCKSDYLSSEVKYVVDAWADAKFTNGELASDINGYKARLITKEELEELGYHSFEYTVHPVYYNGTDVPTWVYNVGAYWTMSNYSDDILVVLLRFKPFLADVWASSHPVRPVVNVYKSKL